MSTMHDAAGAPARPTNLNEQPAAERRFAIRRRIAIGAGVVVLGWSLVELAGLIAVHTTGPELYGVLVALLATAAAAATLALLRSPERILWATVAVIALWIVIALGGLAGMVAHIVGPAADHGPVDPRPRPIAAPLIFTLFGLVGSAALWLGQRRSGRSVDSSRKEWF